ncbi:MAG: glycosyltransferase family 4 protein, partial [Rhodothermales bacterium]|nr:glycosyltransferase family 4 protein [Rhodothermales bacterium]
MRNGKDKTTCAVPVLHLGSPTGLYGAERWILAILRYLDPSEIRSFVAVIQDDEPADQVPLCDAAASMGIETTVFHSPGKLSLSAIGQIRRFIEDNAIGIVHSHGYKTDIIGLLATRGTGCKVVSTPHGWSVANEGLMLTLYEILDRISFLFMDAVVPLSPELYDGLARWPFMNKKLRFIRNGVDLRELDAELSRHAKVRPDGEGIHFAIGYIGRLTPLKCVDVLIQACSQLEGVE